MPKITFKMKNKKQEENRTLDGKRTKTEKRIKQKRKR